MAKTASCNGQGEPGSPVLSLFHPRTSVQYTGKSLLKQLSTIKTSGGILGPSLGKDNTGFVEICPPTREKELGYLRQKWAVTQ